MQKPRVILATFSLLALCSTLSACGDDDDEGLTEAQRHGVGAACDDDSDCYFEDIELACLSFKGGVLRARRLRGRRGLVRRAPRGAHEDGKNYCFLTLRREGRL